MMTQNKPVKIVFAGAPCSGKTTVMSHLKAVAPYRMLKIPETANALFTGRTPELWALDDRVLRQSYIRACQLALEATVEEAARVLGSRSRTLILCDRGIYDSLVYLRPEELRFLGREDPIRHTPYDLVVFFEGESKPSQDDATIRIEDSAEENARLAARTEQVWTGLEISTIRIPQQPTPEDKARLTAWEINRFLGEEAVTAKF